MLDHNPGASPEWWKNTVIYQIYPRSFFDSNADGIGDLRGVIQKLDYIAALGVETIWLCPIYQSPNADNGYDISDYRRIMEEFGTMDDFHELLAQMKQRNLRILLDLVVNHTSDEHPWFVESRKSKDNPFRDYYIWQKGQPGGLPPTNWKSFFSGSAWQHDVDTGEYYLHLFAVKQPDLNWENPDVREEIYDMMRFWFDKGVDGFRLDVVTYYAKDPHWLNHDYSEYAHLSRFYHSRQNIHHYLREMNEQVLSRYDCFTVGEAPGVTPEEALNYVDPARQELNLVFLFDHMRLDRELTNVNVRRAGGWDFVEFKRIFSRWEHALGERGWNSIFLGNHDFPRIVSRWGNDKEFRIPSAKLLAILLLSMHGTPCLYQGDEIGMTNGTSTNPDDYEDVSLRNALAELAQSGGDFNAFMEEQPFVSRDNARFPMQWKAGQHGGFTTASQPWLMVNPNHTDINVAQQEDDPDSILNFYRRMIRLRKRIPALVYGRFHDLLPEDPQLFCYTRTYDHEIWLITLNFSNVKAHFSLPHGAEDIGKPAISNYPDPPQHRENKLYLRPWEAALYQIKNS